MIDMKDPNIVTLGGGAIIEKANIALKKVGDDINDLNKKAKAVRRVTIVVEFRPDEMREMAGIKINAKASLADDKEFETMAVMGKNADGEFVMAELPKPNQQNFLDGAGNVKPISMGNKTE